MTPVTYVNGGPIPPWWVAVRRLVTFVLGVVVIIDALAANHDTVSELLVGVLLLGIVPVDELLGHVRRRRASRPPTPAPASSEGGETD